MKNYLKTFTLLLLTLFLFSNCEQKDDLENINIEQVNEKSYTIERVSFNQLENDNDFYQISNTFQLEESLVSARSNTSFKKKSDCDDFSINFTSAKKLSNDNGFSYTFLIERKDQELYTFENLVIEKDIEGNVNGYIIKYQSDQYWDEGNKEAFKGSVSISPYAKNINELIDKVRNKNNFSQKIASRTTCGQTQFFFILVQYSCTGASHYGSSSGCQCGITDHNCTPPSSQTYTFQTYVPCNEFSNPNDLTNVDGNSSGGGGGLFGDPNGGNNGSGSAILGPNGINVPNRDFLVNGISNAPFASTYANYFNKSWQLFNFLESTNFVKYNKPENKPIFQGLKELSNVIQQGNYTISKEDFKVLYERQKFIINLLDTVNFDFYALPVEQQKEIARNALFIATYPSFKDFGIEFPQNAEEWAEFGEFLITVLKELVPELIPGVGEVIALKNAISAFNSGNYSDGSTELAFAIVGIFPVGKAIKAVGKIAKGMKIVVKLSKAFKNAKKMRNVISSNYNSALASFNRIGRAGSQGVREISGSSKKHGKTFFDQLTKNATGTNTIYPNGKPIIIKTMPDGSKIQFRDWATQSDGHGTKATIQFIGGNYNNLIKKLKFND